MHSLRTRRQQATPSSPYGNSVGVGCTGGSIAVLLRLNVSVLLESAVTVSDWHGYVDLPGRYDQQTRIKRDFKNSPRDLHKNDYTDAV